MPPENERSRRLAMLIDADNAQPAIVEGLLAEVSKYGVAGVRRVYGDWTQPNLGGWKSVLSAHSIQPIRQFRYTTGKNATDGAMMIDAMDLLYSGNLDGFCIVSSDSDFTRLAARLRESGLLVYGFGEKKTPGPFVAACDRFIFTELLRPQDEDTGAPARKSSKQLKQDTKLANLLRSAVEAASDDTDWAPLSTVGSTMAKQASEFDARNYGYAKLSGLVKAIGLFEIEERLVGEGPHKAISLKNRLRA